jgi:hypothetical protein|eukprot:COSAG06_NODE_5780_length_3277_cov_3.417558_1_plen_56_part_00
MHVQSIDQTYFLYFSSSIFDIVSVFSVVGTSEYCLSPTPPKQMGQFRSPPWQAPL